jgi:hypothetical protein
MTATSIRFLSPDRATPFHLRRISYRLTNGRIERAEAVSTNTGLPPWTFPALGKYQHQVGHVVGSPIFTYYDADGTAVTSPSEVAGVTIKVVVSLPQQQGRQYAYATSVALRVEQ